MPPPATPADEHRRSTVAPALGTTMLGFHPQGPFADLRVRVAVAAAVTEVGIEAGADGDRCPTGPRRWPAAAGDAGTRAPRPARADDGRGARRCWPRPATRTATGCPPCGRRCPPTCALLESDLIESLGELGVEIEILWIERGTSLSTLDCHFTLSTWIADYPDPDGFFRGLLGERHERVLGDDELSRLVAEARASRDRDARLALYSAVDRRLVEQALLVPVAYSRAVLLRRAWVKGVWANPLTPIRFDLAVVDR